MDWSHPGQRELVSSPTGVLGEVPINAILDHGSLQDLVSRTEQPCPFLEPFATMTEEERGHILPGDKIFVRNDILPGRKSAKAILVWVSSDRLGTVMSSLERTVMRCRQEVDMGLYHKDTRIVVIMDKPDHDKAELFSYVTVQDHPFVSAIELGNASRARAIVHNYNYYHAANGLTKTVSHIQDFGKDFAASELYYNPVNLGEHTIRVVAVPYAQYFQADFLTPEQGSRPFHRLGNFRGQVVEMMNAFKKAINVDIEYFNAEPIFDYGVFNETGHWTGLVGMLERGEVDVSHDLNFRYGFHQSLESLRFGDLEYISLASPQNLPTPHIFAMLKPFSTYLWLGILVAYVLSPFAYYMVFSTVADKRNIDHSILFDIYWYCFGVLVGELKAKDAKLSYVM